MSLIKICASDLFSFTKHKDSSFTDEIAVYDKINDFFQIVFSLYPDSKPSENITEKDFNIINSFTNEKSFEKAVDVCLRLLSKYSQQEYEKSSDEDWPDDCVTRDSQIIVTCMNQLIDCKVPHHYKPGFLILLVRYCYFG